MEIAFERLDESLQLALVSLSVFRQSFKRDAAETMLGDTCAEALTNLMKRCLIQKEGDRYLIHSLKRSYAKQIGQRKEFGQILADGKHGYVRHFLSLILRNAEIYWAKDTCKESLKLFKEERINLEFTLREVAKGGSINAPRPPLRCATVGYDCLYVRGLNYLQSATKLLRHCT